MAPQHAQDKDQLSLDLALEALTVLNLDHMVCAWSQRHSRGLLPSCELSTGKGVHSQFKFADFNQIPAGDKKQVA